MNARAPDMTSIVDQLVAHSRKDNAGGQRAWDNSNIRQKLIQFRSEAEAIRLAGLRQLTRRLKGRPPGSEGSMLKLAYSELNVELNKFAAEMLGPYGSTRVSGAVCRQWRPLDLPRCWRRAD